MHIVDLHVHSDKSDGSLSPSRLVDLAKEKGLDAFALTDHDTIDGLDEAIRYNAAVENAMETDPVRVTSANPVSARRLEIIPGIELSTEYMGKDIHILGLFIDYHMPAFRQQIRAFVDSRILRNEKMCRLLQEAGIDITFEKLQEAFPGSRLYPKPSRGLRKICGRSLQILCPPGKGDTGTGGTPYPRCEGDSHPGAPHALPYGKGCPAAAYNTSEGGGACWYRSRIFHLFRQRRTGNETAGGKKPTAHQRRLRLPWEKQAGAGNGNRLRRSPDSCRHPGSTAPETKGII